MYRSRDVAGNTAYRIPSSFTSAHAYAATMASTSALIMGVWLSRSGRWRPFLGVAMLATLIGVFMAAARTHMIVVAIVSIVAALSGRVRMPMRFGFIFAILLASFVIMSSERLQRFRTLDETSDVTERIGGSVNIGFITLAERYPMGVGLGGGGTSLPYFLASRVKERVLIENEYGRIMLEQGIPGLLMWLGFLTWTFSRPGARTRTQLPEVRRLAWVVSAVYWATAATGTGLLTSVPHTAVLMLYMGWLVAPMPVEREAFDARPLRAPDALMA
jgi:O-antigen ligase